MKAAILAGGRGKRLGKTTDSIPKPLVDIGGRPLLWHLLAYYATFDIRDFVIALGYLGDRIQDYFHLHGYPNGIRSIELVDTGLNTATGGRIKRLQPYLGDDTFMLTWGDGLSDVDLHQLDAFHRKHGKAATVTAVQPPSKFGRLEMVGDRVVRFEEKPDKLGIWINGAFFVLEPAVLNYIDGDETVFEREPLERLSATGELMAFRHHGFWQCMDTSEEWERLQRLWASEHAPWAARIASGNVTSVKGEAACLIG